MRLSWLTLGKHPKADLIRMAKECEAAGFETLWHADERFFLETYSSLTLCATATETIYLGPGVTDPYSRHPALTAMAIGTLDHFSDGRAVLGLGAGSSGFRQLLIKRVQPAKAVRETVQVVRALLAGEKVTLDGEVIQLQDCQLNFIPRGPVPTIIASNGQLIIRVAGEVADGVMSSSVLVQPRIDEVLNLVEEGLHTARRRRSDISVWSRLNISIHPDSSLAYDALKPMIFNLIAGKYPDTGMFDRLGLVLPDDLRHAVETVGPTHDPETKARVAKLVPNEFIDKTCLVGNAAQIVEQLQGLEKAGFDGAALYPIPAGDQDEFAVLRQVVEEIVPVVR